MVRLLCRMVRPLAAAGFIALVGATAMAQEKAAPGVRVLLATSAGNITLQLDAEKAPRSAANFLEYVKAGHYDGTVFHRVIDGFMIQGGGFTAQLTQKETKPPVQNEADNGLKNERGTIAMARTSAPDSATSQFFINVADNKALNFRSADAQGYGYTVFGKVVDGMDVVDRIAKAPTGAGGPFPKDVPTEKVVINKAVVVDAAK